MSMSFCITIFVLFTIPVAIKSRTSRKRPNDDESTTTNGNLSFVLGGEANSSSKNSDRHCDTEDCLRFRWLVDTSLDSAKDPCQNFHAFVCAGLEQKSLGIFPRSYGGMIGATSRNLRDSFHKKLSTAQVPPEKQDAFQKAAAVFQNCLKVKKEQRKNRKEIVDFLKLHGLSFPDELRFDPLDILIRFVVKIDIPLLFSMQPALIGRPPRVLIQLTVAPYFTSEKFSGLQRIVDGRYHKFISEVLSTIFSTAEDKTRIGAIVKAELEVISASNVRDFGNDTVIVAPLAYFGFLQNSELSGSRWKDTLARHTNNRLPGHFMLRVNTHHMKLLHFLFDSSSDLSDNTLKIFLAWRTTLYLYRTWISVLETSSKERCFGTVSSVFPLAAVSEVLSQTVNKTRVSDVKNMTEIIVQEIAKLFTTSTWLDDESRNASLKKLSLMKRCIGYDLGPNSRSIEELYPDFTGPYIADFIAIRKAVAELRWQNLYGGLIKNNQCISPPVHAGKAFYNTEENTVFVPAGAMVGPLFTFGAPPEVNVATLGSLLAHEIMRGFDDVGRQHDGFGKQTRLWTKESEAAYRKSVTCFNETTVQRGKHREYSKEILLDLLGQRFVLNAYRSASERFNLPLRPVKGLTKDRLFYVSRCMIWCGSPGSHLQERCNVPLMYSPHFSETFHCSSGAPMNPQKKCIFWHNER
ncbi:membrane metallo-endopeptidase-like 1 [Ornithodoros turicata]|uniref:membrane metallo-endopeptidase-like 1 n=1 Tax=Ornithodoros turicata TaxID=34597 RepID=UPI003139A61D